jgi:hypothetical protein
MKFAARVTNWFFYLAGENAIVNFESIAKNMVDVEFPSDRVNLVARCRRHYNDGMAAVEVRTNQGARFRINITRQVLVEYSFAKFDKLFLFYAGKRCSRLVQQLRKLGAIYLVSKKRKKLLQYILWRKVAAHDPFPEYGCNRETKQYGSIQVEEGDRPGATWRVVNFLRYIFMDFH